MKIWIPGIRIDKVQTDRISIFCPIHKGGQERRPAAVIYLDSGTWKCHACGQKGTVADLLGAVQVTGPAAKKIIRELEWMGERIRKEGPVVPQAPVCNEYLLGPFHRRPLNLINEGFSREVLDEMEVGFDEARFRVIYPVRSPKGQLHGVVGGAVVPETDYKYLSLYGYEPKYLAYGQKQGFPHQLNPKWTLWNVHRLNPTSKDPLVVVEGFKALMKVKMAGIQQVVALFGTAYDRAQVQILYRLGGPYLLFLDNDKAGRAATKRLVGDLRTLVGGVKVVEYPRDVKQPDDLTFEEMVRCLRWRQKEKSHERNGT